MHFASDAAQRQKLRATGADVRNGRMSREESARGEVGGRAREWGGVVQVAAHSFQHAAYTSNRHHDSLFYV